MYGAAREFDEPEVPPQALLDVVYDVARYPEFVHGVSRVSVREDDGRRALAEFAASMWGMDFEYVLLVERLPDEVRWRRVSGAFRHSEGSLTHLGGGRFRYANALDPGFAVPGFAVRFVLSRSLPRFITELRERARALARQGPPG